VSANPMVLNTVLDSCSDVAEFGRIAEATIANSHGDEDAVQVRKIARFTCAPENHGERLWVSKAMGELCAAAAATLPEELAGTTLSADDLPWPSGTVVFETPLFVVPEGFVEYALGEGPIDVIQWSSDSQGVFMVAWQSRHGSEPLGFPRYLPRFAFQLPYGLIPEGVDDDIAFRRLVSLWSMLRQRIALTEKRQAPRPSWKRWTRKHGHEPKDIIVVTLRRPTIHHNDDAPGGGVSWTHQWLVGGHWRHQPYGPANSLRRLQWIAPFIKGPEDMPLVVKDKINAWTR
jgi:hypothetical protein